jgi:outer membrane protein assembly factor BamB
MNRDRFYQLAVATALAAGLFVVLIGGLLAYNAWRGKVATLVNSKEVVRLHQELRKQPKDEALKQRIRQLDLQLRQNTFYRLELSRNTSRALLWGAAIFLASAHFARTVRRRLPDPLAWGARPADEERRGQRFARYAVAAMFAVTAFTAVVLSQQPVQLPVRQPVTVVETPVSMDEFARQWPAFRGPNGQGVAPNATVALPLNLRWKTEVPLPGMSSPIIWDNAVFLTGATETENHVFRFDAETGALVWSVAVNAPKPPKPEVISDTGFAAPTAVADGRRVYAIFADGLIAAFNFDGKQIWARNIGPLENAYGYAASLALFEDRLLIQIDRGMSAEEELSKLVALDTRTGQELWQKKRDVAGSWSSPVVVTIDGKPQLLAGGPPLLVAYDPRSGAEIWQNKCLESDVAPSPVFANGMLVTVAPNTAIIGLRPGDEAPVWKVEDGVPDATSPVTDGERVYTVSSEGMLNCLALETGKVVWTHEFQDSFYASPLLVGQTLLLVSRDGTLYLLAPGTAYRELGKLELGEDVNASPAPVGNRLYLRGSKHLFCLEK